MADEFCGDCAKFETLNEEYETGICAAVPYRSIKTEDDSCDCGQFESV